MAMQGARAGDLFRLQLARSLAPQGNPTTPLAALGNLGRLAASLYMQQNVMKGIEDRRTAADKAALAALQGTMQPVYGTRPTVGDVDLSPPSPGIPTAQIGERRVGPGLQDYMKILADRDVGAPLQQLAAAGYKSAVTPEQFTFEQFDDGTVIAQSNKGGVQRIGKFPKDSFDYKERDVDIGNDMRQKQVSPDGGKTWVNLGTPFSRFDPYIQSQYVDEEGNTRLITTRRPGTGGASGADGVPGTGGAAEGISGTVIKRAPPPSEKAVNAITGGFKALRAIRNMKKDVGVVVGMPAFANAAREFFLEKTGTDPARFFGKTTTDKQAIDYVTNLAIVKNEAQQIISGIPSNFDVQTFFLQLAPLNVSKDVAEARLDVLQGVMREAVRLNLAYAKASGRAIPPAIREQAAEFGISVDGVSADTIVLGKRYDNLADFMNVPGSSLTPDMVNKAQIDTSGAATSNIPQGSIIDLTGNTEGKAGN